MDERNSNSAPPTPNLRNTEKEFRSEETTETTIFNPQGCPKGAEHKKAVTDINTPKTIGNKKNIEPIAGGTVLKERTRSQRSNK